MKFNDRLANLRGPELQLAINNQVVAAKFGIALNIVVLAGLLVVAHMLSEPVEDELEDNDDNIDLE